MTYSVDFSRLFANVESWCNNGLIAGAVVGIGDANSEMEVRGIGDGGTFDTPVPMPDNAQFAIASISKTITSLQLMTLVEDGMVSLTAPVAEYVPEFAANGKATVTAWHLLTHTSGISQSANTMEGPASHRPPTDHLQAVLIAPLEFEPGTRVDYFSPAFWVIAEMISRVTMVPYWEHLRSRVLDPAGLVDTGYFADLEPPSRLMPARAAPESSQVPSDADWGVVDPRTATMEGLAEDCRKARYPAGGMLSTAQDLLRYGRLYLNGGLADNGIRVMTSRTIDLMSTPWTIGLPAPHMRVEAGPRTERGLGWAIGGPGDLRSDSILWHQGGFGTAMWIDLREGFVFVLLTASWYLRIRLLGEFINSAYGCLP